jgi:hypothetical protein
MKLSAAPHSPPEPAPARVVPTCQNVLSEATDLFQKTKWAALGVVAVQQAETPKANPNFGVRRSLSSMAAPTVIDQCQTDLMTDHGLIQLYYGWYTQKDVMSLTIQIFLLA